MIRTAFVGLLALAACGRRGSDDEDAAPPAVVSVGTAVAGRGVFQETVDATGEAAAGPDEVIADAVFVIVFMMQAPLWGLWGLGRW